MLNFLKRCVMPTVVRISDSLLKDARKYSKVEHRSLSGQIEHWARIGKCAEDVSEKHRDWSIYCEGRILHREWKHILKSIEIGRKSIESRSWKKSCIWNRYTEKHAMSILVFFNSTKGMNQHLKKHRKAIPIF